MSTPTQPPVDEPVKQPWPISHLPSIGERLRTQDNRGTAEPSFCVQEKHRDAGEFGYVDRWETVMVAFTAAGAQDYIRQNGHNHGGELRIYVESFRRCEEMIAIRKALMDGIADPAELRRQRDALLKALKAIKESACDGNIPDGRNLHSITQAAMKAIAAAEGRPL